MPAEAVKDAVGRSILAGENAKINIKKEAKD
jgi:hypothetical protein